MSRFMPADWRDRWARRRPPIHVTSAAISLFGLGLCWLWLLMPAQAVADDRPNLLLMVADDLGYETVGCYGGTSYETPNLDQLARQGIRFDQAFAMPLCTNTRVQLMTGRYNQRNWSAFGILDPQATTFGHELQDAGYQTCIAGKWQLYCYDPPNYPGAELRRETGMRAEHAGFANYSLWHTGHTEDKGSRYADPVIDQDGQFRPDTAGKYGPDLWVDYICDFMQLHQNEPFFVYYPMALPHNPMVPTPDSPEWSDPGRRHSDETQFAADMIRYTDKLVGKLVSQLDQLGLRERTLVLFYSDNGTNVRVQSRLGDQLVRGGKGLATDLGIRVPMIASWPGTVPTDTVSDDLIDSVDFFPTLLEIAGVSPDKSEALDGISFAPLLLGGEGHQREWVFIHQDPRPGWDKDRFERIRLARDKRFKLYEDGRLYDLHADRFEAAPISLPDDSGQSRQARSKLQAVLDSMKPYPLFDPAEVPRPDPHRWFADYEFHDQGGLVVAEAELLPTPRDESWLNETELGNYTGTGYLRALRDQTEPIAHGQTRVAINAANAGPWHVAIRCRSDHASGEAENAFWLRLEDGEWIECRLESDAKQRAGTWQWVTVGSKTTADRHTPLNFDFQEKRNNLWVAPKTANLKIDRIVCYQADQQAKAFQLSTPVSPFHPWASP